MDRVEYLIGLLDDESPLFRKYMVRRRKWGAAPVFVFEGDDEKYYSATIGSMINGEYHCFIAGNRNNSISLRKAIDSNRQCKSDLTYFFIDKDFFYSEIASGRVYVTPCHSIENFYCEPAAVRRLLRSESGLSKAKLDEFDEDEILDSLMQLYLMFHQQFINLRITKKSNLLLYLFTMSGFNFKLNLNTNFGISSKFRLADGVVCMQSELVLKGGLPGILRTHVAGNLYQKRKDIRAFNARPVCRGKQEFEFLLSFLLSCVQGSIHSYIKEKYRYEFKLGIGAATSDLLSFGAQYARKPECLIDFLRAANDEIQGTLKAA
jgi:hypothetical protein